MDTNECEGNAGWRGGIVLSEVESKEGISSADVIESAISLLACGSFTTGKKEYVTETKFGVERTPLDFKKENTARASKKRSKKCERVQYICMKKSMHRGFRGPNNFLLARRIFS